MPWALAASTTSSSRIEPPGWIAARAPCSAAATSPSANGKNASEATTQPSNANPDFFPYMTATSDESMRLIWPAPMPIVAPSRA